MVKKQNIQLNLHTKYLAPGIANNDNKDDFVGYII